jgi:hypothetical protein
MVMVVWVSMIKVCSNFGLLVVEIVQNLVKLRVEMVVEFLVVVVRKFEVGTMVKSSVDLVGVEKKK